MTLKDKIALVTGASRGIGRGIALQLGSAHATVYITGRKPRDESSDLPSLEETEKEINRRGGQAVVVYCDHSKPEEVEQLFKRIESEHNGKLDIMVNNAYSAVPALMSTAGKGFWELDPLFWDEVNNVGLRNHYICSVYAARLMVPHKQGLIVNVSSAGGLAYLFNVAYGVGKAALDRMSADCAIELRPHNVSCVSLWPGPVNTEQVHKAASSTVSNTVKRLVDLCATGESTEYAGKCVVHLAEDVNMIRHTGKVLITRDLGDLYGFVDVDGKKPQNLRSVKTLLGEAGWSQVASYTPEWIRVPCWMMTLYGYKF